MNKIEPMPKEEETRVVQDDFSVVAVMFSLLIFPK